MPTEVAFTLGYNLSCISPSIVVPGLMSLNDRGYGRSKNIAGILIAAGTFDDIICIICFGICKTVALLNGGFSGDSSMGLEIGRLFIDNLIGLAIGVILGLAGWLLKYVKSKELRMYLKLAWCVIIAMCMVIIEEVAHGHDAKYIASLSFGYTSFRVWGAEKPAKEIGWFWFFLQPCLFGTVGGSLLFS
jgi:NhaP-type Na+/H+ or K+/H+ antiporter